MKAIRSLENLLKGGNYIKRNFVKRNCSITKINRQEGGLLNFLKQLITAGLPLMKSVLTLLAKSVLLPLGLSAGMSAADAAVQNKICRSETTASIISNEEIKDIMKIFKSLQESGLLIKGISEKIKDEAKEQKGEFLLMSLGTLNSSMLGIASTGKRVIRAGESTIRAGENFQYYPIF